MTRAARTQHSEPNERYRTRLATRETPVSFSTRITTFYSFLPHLCVAAVRLMQHQATTGTRAICTTDFFRLPSRALNTRILLELSCESVHVDVQMLKERECDVPSTRL